MSKSGNKLRRSALITHFLPGDFKGARTQNLSPAAWPLGAFAAVKAGKPATLTSAPVPSPIPFDQLLFSASVYPPAGGFEAEVRVKTRAGWSPWFSLGMFGAGRAASAKKSENAFGVMDTDVLKLKQSASAFRYRITLRPGKNAGALRFAAAVCTDTKLPYAMEAARPDGLGPVKLEVPAFSQMTQRSPRARDLCSPTSLAMAISAAGAKAAPLAVAAAVKDHAADIYGNWFFNTAYAGSRGLCAFLTRFNSFEEARCFIDAGIPVIASLTIDPGELKGSPVKKTRGHLVVIKGFTAKGDVIVNDPGAPGAATVERVYKRAQFARVWLDRKFGTAYIAARSLAGLLAVKTHVTELFSRPPGPGRAEHDRLIESQLITNERVELLETEGAWARVKVLEQPDLAGPGLALEPYQGWVKAADIGFALQPPAKAVIHSKTMRHGGRHLSIGVKLPALPARLANANTLPVKAGPALRASILKTARQFLGDRYYWGGRSAWGVDCSGLANIAYRAWGVDLPRNAGAQLAACRRIARKDLRPADLIFTSGKKDPARITHVMLYAGGDRLVESTRESDSVREVTFETKFGLPFAETEQGRLPDGRHIFFGAVL